jgi:opacity protein-like surface antigen
MWQISFPPNQVYSGTIKTQSLFLQAQLDLLNYWGFAPYLEGGIGMAKHELSGYSVANPNYIMTIPNGTHTNFAWLFGIGVGYHFTAYAHEMIVSLGARYVDKGVAQSGIVYAQSNPNQGGVLQQSIRDTELGLNLRYIF